MVKRTYLHKAFSAEALDTIETADGIVTEYMDDGLCLTLRQLYYQFVARGLLENTTQAYKRLGALVSDARLAGELDWDGIEDRTRGVEEAPTWDSLADFMLTAAQWYRVDARQDQPQRIEVWCEKAALAGVLEPVCREERVAFLACRGYLSQSEAWRAAQRFRTPGTGNRGVVLYFGDHDPSGLDMDDDIRNRMRVFGLTNVAVTRVALTETQIKTHGCPPNPAKVTDSRAAKYIARHGRESWELDALEPRVLAELARQAIRDETEDDPVGDAERIERQAQATMRRWRQELGNT